MQTTSIETFKARHFDKPKAHQADALKSLTIKQLKFLADKHQISIKGKVEGNILVGYTKKAPTKQQYINKLSHVVSGADLRAIPQEAKQTVKKPVKN